VSIAFFQQKTETRLVVGRTGRQRRRAGPDGRADRPHDDVRSGVERIAADRAAAHCRRFAVTAKTAWRMRRRFRPSTRPACRFYTPRCGRASGRRRATPAEAIARLNAAVAEALGDPKSSSGCATSGRSRSADQRSVAALAAFQQAEADKWWPIIKGGESEGD